MKTESSFANIKTQLTRRRFLKLSGWVGLGMATPLLMPVGAEAVRYNRKLYKVSETRLDMGTFVSMTLIHPSRDQAQEAMGLAFEEIGRLTRLMNRFSQNTAVGLLNHEGKLKHVPPEVSQVIRQALYYFKITNGAFDITVKPIVDLYMERFSKGNKQPPSEAELHQLLQRVGAENIILEGHTIQFKKEGMGVTLDGIAKGYIVDQASKTLSNHGIANHLINAGGDIRTAGHAKDSRPWTIAIQDPMKKRHYPDIIRMSSGAIATSGNYEVYFDREKMFHHIVNPKTGHSPLETTSASVIAKTTLQADALSTSVFVMSPTQGTRFINALGGCECLLITRGNKILKSAGWKSATT
ncbi:MAG: FAD:protein FMN transferase [Deltaproteobacteria bacterium]|nr:MAG: FAD:protein FMN transferase [Deltaproteobacteria bacterium]